MPVTKEQAASAYEFHYGECSRTEGPRGGITEKVEVWRRNGATKTWKTRPAEFSVPIKHGMRSYHYIDHTNADMFHTAADCPLNKEEAPSA